MASTATIATTTPTAPATIAPAAPVKPLASPSPPSGSSFLATAGRVRTEIGYYFSIAICILLIILAIYLYGSFDSAKMTVVSTTGGMIGGFQATVSFMDKKGVSRSGTVRFREPIFQGQVIQLYYNVYHPSRIYRYDMSLILAGASVAGGILALSLGWLARKMARKYKGFADAEGVLLFA